MRDKMFFFSKEWYTNKKSLKALSKEKCVRSINLIKNYDSIYLPKDPRATIYLWSPNDTVHNSSNIILNDYSAGEMIKQSIIICLKGQCIIL